MGISANLYRSRSLVSPRAALPARVLNLSPYSCVERLCRPDLRDNFRISPSFSARRLYKCCINGSTARVEEETKERVRIIAGVQF